MYKIPAKWNCAVPFIAKSILAFHRNALTENEEPPVINPRNDETFLENRDFNRTTRVRGKIKTSSCLRVLLINHQFAAYYTEISSHRCADVYLRLRIEELPQGRKIHGPTRNRSLAALDCILRIINRSSRSLVRILPGKSSIRWRVCMISLGSLISCVKEKYFSLVQLKDCSGIKGHSGPREK